MYSKLKKREYIEFCDNRCVLSRFFIQIQVNTDQQYKLYTGTTDTLEGSSAGQADYCLCF